MFDSVVPLPTTSPLFQQEFYRQEEVTEADHLAHWERFPPYHPSSLVIHHGISGFLDLIQGRRRRAQYQYEELRLGRYRNTSNPVFLQEIHSEITKLVSEWLELNKLLKTTNLTDIDSTMGRSLLEWKARRVVDLIADWKAVKKGRDGDDFIILYTNRW
jgi:hypothetical protein